MKYTIDKIIEQIYEATIIRAFENNISVLEQYYLDKNDALVWMNEEVDGISKRQINEILIIVEKRIERQIKKTNIK